MHFRNSQQAWLGKDFQPSMAHVPFQSSHKRDDSQVRSSQEHVYCKRVSRIRDYSISRWYLNAIFCSSEYCRNALTDIISTLHKKGMGKIMTNSTFLLRVIDSNAGRYNNGNELACQPRILMHTPHSIDSRMEKGWILRVYNLLRQSDLRKRISRYVHVCLN